MTRVPFTGNETVLDAISQIGGLPAVSSKRHIWIARRSPGPGGPNNVLEINWQSITQCGGTDTNYQMMPGDRLYVKSDKLIRFDNGLGKVLAPVERVFGGMLLGSEAINSVRGRSAR